ncbi:MFS transporter [Bradyrhizobium jicamae]|uniref:MFS transporter n=1 Tax=Bradyrhizobium jicamae TaxID=280332 RepID=A0ABS5FWZ9_9BRAD|nr:MFS transporter [Bradyrhizobium jicamae]MBR0801317.1 MFS transporter [Bradyrhizobium jicamae]
MNLHVAATDNTEDRFLFGARAAWFAYGMTVALMVFDYVDRQVIVSMFPFLKVEWNLSDKELGLLVSVISITVAVFGIPVAWIADRVSRVKSVVVMAVIWSLACISCMFSQSYAQLLAARAVVGLGEAGYGSVGAAMVAAHFPPRMRGGLLGGFFASASVGSVLGVVLGGVVAARFGWQSAFGIVGIPGLVVALLYLFVRDYRTVVADAKGVHASAQASAPSKRSMIASIGRSATVRWVCVGAAAELIAVSALWSWLPSFLNRTYGLAPERAGMQAALVVLAGAFGSLVLGIVVDRAGLRSARGRFLAVSVLCLAAMATLMFAFGSRHLGIELGQASQFGAILFGGFLATCTVGPAAATVLDVIHPGVRSTGASVLSLFQNLFGLAIGPLIGGMLSDAVGLDNALTLTPLACIVAATAFLMAGGGYQADRQRAEAPASLANSQEAFA